VLQSWPVVERLAALSHLVEACDLAEVRHLLSVAEPQFQRDFISLLPKEVGSCLFNVHIANLCYIVIHNI
jgi:hypothetical protein